MHSARRTGQRGATLVESALTLILFLALFIGIFDIGEMLFVHQTLMDRTRNAARWGAVNTYDPTSIQNLVLYGAIAPATGQVASFGLGASNVIVSRPGGSIGTAEDRIVVTVTYPVSLVSVLIGSSAASGGNTVKTWNLTIRVSTPYEVPG